jgi:ketosteroid isomerase-like protein
LNPVVQSSTRSGREPGPQLCTELYSHEPDEIWRMHMPAEDRLKLARAGYEAYESGDRGVIEELLTDDFTFYSPADVGIDRATYFERCWPNAELIKAFEFDRLVEAGDEVIVTYESTKTDGRRFRNTEVLAFDGDKICRQEVYFGWNLE